MIILFSPIFLCLNTLLLLYLYSLGYEESPEPATLVITFLACLETLVLAYILKALKKPLFRITATIVPIALLAAYGWIKEWDDTFTAIAALGFFFALAWLYLAEFACIALIVRRLRVKNETSPPSQT